MESLPFLLSINSHVRTSHRSCRPRHCAIYSYTVFFRSTANQRGNRSPILAIVLLYCIFQRAVFFFCPCTRMRGRLVVLTDQGTMPPMHKLLVRSTRKQRGSCHPFLAVMLLYYILQLDVFFFCPFTLACGRRMALGFQGTVPSTPTLAFRSTRNQCGNSSPVLAIVHVYCILQRAVFFFCPSNQMCDRLVILGVQGTVPSTRTLVFRSVASQFLPLCFSTASFCQRGNCNPIRPVHPAILLLAGYLYCRS
jgi:hypothetical protein